MIDRQSSLALVEPDAASWDAFVQTHPQGNLLQRSGWGALKSRFGWGARRVALMGPQGIHAGAQVLIKQRLGLAGAYVPRGPLFSGDADTDRLLLTALDRLCKRNRAIFLRLEPNLLELTPEAHLLHSQLLLLGFQAVEPLQPRTTVHLDLAPEPERLLAAMSKGHRADIKRATREQVVVRVGVGSPDLDAFYSIMESTGARAGFSIHSREYYAAAFDIFHPHGDALLLLAEWQGTPVATAMVFADIRAGLYLYSGSTTDGLKSGAQHMLQWHAIQWARTRGCQLYDFWGVPDAFGQAALAVDEAERVRLEEAAKADPLYGVYRFKKGFGGGVVRYLPAYDRVYIPALYRIWKSRMG